MDFETTASARIRELRVWMGVVGSLLWLYAAVYIAFFLSLGAMMGAAAAVVIGISLLMILLVVVVIIPGRILIRGALAASKAHPDAPGEMVAWASLHGSFWSYVGKVLLFLVVLYAVSFGIVGGIGALYLLG